MNKKKKTFVDTSWKNWLSVTIALTVIGICIIAMSGATYLGQIMTYATAYLFGTFHYLFYVFFILLALYFAIKKKLFPVKNKGFLWTGIILLFITILGLGSLDINRTNPDLTFTGVSSFYAVRMKGFASSVISIDNYPNIATLGGGFIGLSLTTLLFGVWGYVGNVIFLVFLLLLSVFFIVFRPITTIVDEIRNRKNQKVTYDSPYHPVKGKENQLLNRDITQEIPVVISEVPPVDVGPDPKLCQPFEKDWRGKPNERRKGVFHSGESTAFMNQSSLVLPQKENVSSMMQEPIVSPVMEKVRKETVEEKTLPAANSAHLEELSRQAKAFSSGAKGPDANTFDAIEPITIPTPKVENNPIFDDVTPLVHVQQPALEEEEVYVKPEVKSVVHQPSVNPLEAVARNVQIKENKENTVVVSSYPNEVEKKTVEVEKKPARIDTPLSEEEKEYEIEKRYFEEKQRMMIEAERQKRQAKMERKALLMRYVSDVPRFYQYPLPTDQLLSEHDDSAKILENSQSAEEKVKIINSVFSDYSVRARAVSYTIGASVTRFNVETEPGEKSDRIASVVDELQRSLNGDKSVRVETVVEGKNTSGIEVGNITPMSVSFKDVFEHIETNTSEPLLVPIGKDITGNIITFPLNKMPHVLIAGTTGSGKSVLVHSMIMTLIMRNYPSQMKLILIDPKQVEFVRYQECSHLFCPVISKAEVAVLALKKLCDEMDRRFALLSKYRVANLESYNALRVGKEASMEQMPYLVCVIDEFADLMMVGGKDVSVYVQRIGQKARAAGIHMIIATQRPSKDSVPMLIKANIPCRIGLSCSSQVDSRVILDENGAETLLGKGDLLFRCPGKKSLIRAQSPFLSDQEIDTVLNYVKQQAGDPNYDREFIELVEMEEEEASTEIDVNKSQYDSVKDFVIHTGITSKESIVRNFQITSQKAETYLATMVSENVLMMGFGGNYVLGPAALAILDSTKE